MATEFDEWLGLRHADDNMRTSCHILIVVGRVAIRVPYEALASPQ